MLKGLELARWAAEQSLGKKATDVKILHIEKISNVADYFVICTGDSDVQTRAISYFIEDELREKSHTKPWHVEGLETGQWVLMDYSDVVVHIFMPLTRQFYGLELLWGDAPVTEVEDPLLVSQSELNSSNSTFTSAQQALDGLL